MDTKSFSRLAVVMALTGCFSATACDEADPADDSDLNFGALDRGQVADDDHLDFTPVDHAVTFRGQFDNGTEMNGAVLNGKYLNGKYLNGKYLNGTALARVNGALTALVELHGRPLTDIQLTHGSLLSGHDGVSTRIGAQLTDTVFSVNFDPLTTGGEDMTFKIVDVVQSGVQPTTYFHTVHQLDGDGVFESICSDGAGNPTQAIALAGTWDPETAVRQPGAGKFTWACRGAALAKAVEWGYQPWVSPEMSDAHEAAMRMIRADYCGDGVTHTSNGNPIDVSDKWGIQVADTSWGVEAKWGPNGAVCLNTPRKLWWTRSSIPCAATLPYCTDDGLVDGAPNTDPAQYGGMLMTQVVPNNNPNAY